MPESAQRRSGQQGDIKSKTAPLKQRYPRFPLTVYLLFYFGKQVVQLSISSRDAEDRLLEASYLVLMVAVVSAGLALTGFVLLELTAAFSFR